MTFPVDELTLDAVEHALGGCYRLEDGQPVLVGADFSLSQLLDFLAGVDHRQDADVLEPVLNAFDQPIPDMVYDPRPCFHPNDVILALITEVRRLRSA